MSEIKQRTRKNQAGEVVIGDGEEMSLDKWQEWWVTGKTQFHNPEPHQMLLKHIDTLTNGRGSCTIFLPLCGKSVDIMWLAKNGHSVIGNEWVELGCRQLFEENDLDYVVSDIPGIPGKLLESSEPDMNISLFCCDLFKLNKAAVGTVDCIWDRGGLVAIERKDRVQYAKTLTDLMSNHTRYLLDTFTVDHDSFAGPPHSMSADDLNRLFGARCTMDRLEERELQKTWDMKYFIENVSLLQLKS